MRNEVLHSIKEGRNSLPTIKMKDNFIGHILHRNCLLKHVIEGKIGGSIIVTRRRGRRSKQLLHDVKEIRGYRKFKQEALDRTMWGKKRLS
jgi:hypothetical protein